MNKLLAILLLLIHPFYFAIANATEGYQIARTEVLPLEDKQTHGQYELYIKLPENYQKEKNKQYPVVYYTDADWHIEMLSSSTEYMLDDVILVGISWQRNISQQLKQEVGDYYSRLGDFTPYPSKDPENQKKYQYGKAQTHLAFIRQQVFPFIESTYRASSTERTYFGYSLGGLFGAYALLKSPDTFKNYILGSPSAFNLADLEKQYRVADPMNANVYITYGDKENPKRNKQIDDFVAQLNDRGDKTLLIKLEVVTGDHSGAFPMTSVKSMNWLSGLTQNMEKL